MTDTPTPVTPTPVIPTPAIQLIANLIVRRADGRVLFVRYDPEDERWWLPGADLAPYEHPEERARKALASLPTLQAKDLRLSHVESFRGRRGWHVVFHYVAQVEGEVEAETPHAWHAPRDLPRTAHGRWEHEAVGRALAPGDPRG